MAVETTSRSLTDVLFDRAREGLCLIAPDGTVVRANAEWLRSTGFTEEQVVGESIVDLFPATRDMALAMHARARAGHRVDVPRHALVVDGRETWWEGSIDPVPMEGGTGLLITAREVTDTTRRDRAGPTPDAPTLDELYASSFEHSPECVIISKPDGTVVRANPAACRAYGISEAEVCRGGRAAHVVHDAALEAFLAERERTGSARGRLTARRGDGTTFPVEVSSSLLRTRGGGPFACIVFRDVTERVRAEEEGKRAEELLRSREADLARAQAAAHLGSWRWDLAEDTVSWSDELYRIFGVDPATFVPSNAAARELVHPDDRDRHVEMVGIALTGNHVPPFESRIVRPTGEERVVLASGFDVELDPAGRPAALFGTILDITERKRAEQAIRASEEEARTRAVELEAVLNCVGDGVIVYDRQGRTVRSSPAADAILGIPQAERAAPVQDRVAAQYEITSEDGRRLGPEDMVAFRAAVRGETVKRVVNRVQRRGHEPRWLLISATPLIVAGEHRGAVLSMTDITERKRGEEALRARDAQFQVLIEELHSGVALIDSGGRFTLYNGRFLELFGLPRDSDIENVNSQNWSAWQVFDEDGRLLHVDEHPVRRAALTREPVSNRLVAVRMPGGGELVWMLVSAEPLLASDGSIQQIICTYHDITDRKRAEEALRQSQAALQAFYESAPLMMGLVELHGDEVIAVHGNARVAALFGITPDRLPGRSWSRIDPNPDVNALWLRAYRQCLETGAPARFEYQQPHAGGVAWISATAAPVPPGESGHPRCSFVAEDVTDRKRAEEALRAINEHLREADRRKDDFLGMLSHELRNPLAPIRNSTYVLQNAAPGSEQAHRARTVIERQTEHLTRLVDDLLDVTRIARGKIELRRARVDLREVLSHAAEDFRVMLHDRGVRFDVVIPEDELWADADRTRITQVVGNLLHNASKFTRKGDAVSLSLEPGEREAIIRVRDTGAGVEAALLPTIFEPFVQGARTLARTDGGLGLGLALVKGIAELHGGTVNATSAGKGKGSEFVVRLPLASAAETTWTPMPRSERRGAVRSVLVVDDNVDAAESLADIVRLLGHSADVAYDGPTAVEKARANPPSVVLCDIGLPGMSGYEVARALRASALDGVHLIAVSGYAQPEDVKRAIAAGFDAHLAKPCDPDKIERLLG